MYKTTELFDLEHTIAKDLLSSHEYPWETLKLIKDEILKLAEKLSKGIPFIRIDFYIVEGKIYFSELTFFPASGFEGYDPPEWDRKFGDWLSLPIK